MEITIVGGGLAGSEAAYQIAESGGEVLLYEMRPKSFTPAHKTAGLAELVCSNSLKSRELSNAHGLLKEELRLLNSLILKAADETAIPGGKALVVDRGRFSALVTATIEQHPRIRVVREELDELPSGVTVIATGPLSAPRISERIRDLTGMENLHFFDAVSPIIDGSTIDMERAFFASRYSEGEGDYLNCVLTRQEYDRFYDELTKAERVDLRDFETTPYFEGCLPIEVMAERGRQTLLYGPMKPVGIIDASSGRAPYAVIQLRREDASGSMYNMVGFQTKLTYPEQERVFRLIPALRSAVFFRHGSIHRNTFINGPRVLTTGLQLKSDQHIFFAGQITGVEGYVESTAMGLVAAISALCFATGKLFSAPPVMTCTGALLSYVTTERKLFQPMNINFGLFSHYDKRRKEKIVRDALQAISTWKAGIKDVLA